MFLAIWWAKFRIMTFAPSTVVLRIPSNLIFVAVSEGGSVGALVVVRFP